MRVPLSRQVTSVVSIRHLSREAFQRQREHCVRYEQEINKLRAREEEDDGSSIHGTFTKGLLHLRRLTHTSVVSLKNTL
jgi:hypothetical protein